jgi:hypothetical protein
VLLDHSAAAELLEPADDGIHRRSDLGRASRGEVLQELVARFQPIGSELVRLVVPLGHRGEDWAEAF